MAAGQRKIGVEVPNERVEADPELVGNLRGGVRGNEQLVHGVTDRVERATGCRRRCHRSSQDETVARLSDTAGVPAGANSRRSNRVFVGKHRHRQARHWLGTNSTVVLVEQILVAALADARDRIAHAVSSYCIVGYRPVGWPAVSVQALFFGAKWQAKVQPVGYWRIGPVVRVDLAKAASARRASTAGPSTPRRPASDRNRGTAATWRPSLKDPLPSAC